jgi:aconitase B
MLDTMADDVYRYLNFDQIDDYQSVARQVKIPVVAV